MSNTIHLKSKSGHRRGRTSGKKNYSELSAGKRKEISREMKAQNKLSNKIDKTAKRVKSRATLKT